jgi:serine protease Do
MLVLLKIETDKPLGTPEMATRDQMRVGQWTLAMGRTFEGNRPNLAVGILSALGRIWGKAIQTDAAASPANYGGPLVDLHGRVLGVLTPLSPKPGETVGGLEWYDSGIAFAVPAEDVVRVLPRLKKGEDLHAGLLGIGLPPGDSSTAEPTIVACRPNSPAAKAGVKAGDRIIEIDGRPVTRAAQVKEALGPRYAGETIALAVLREEKRLEYKVTLADELPPYERPMLGLLPMRSISERPAPGVIVRYVYPEGGAAKAGLQPGDVVESLDGKPLDGADALRGRIAEHEPGDTVALAVRRGQETLKLDVQLGRLPDDIPGEELPAAHAVAESGAEKPAGVGKIEIKIPDVQNDAWAYVPQGYNPAVPHGLVVWLHAPGRVDDEQVLGQWKGLCDKNDLILLVPKASDPAKWLPSEESVVARLVENVLGRYHIDRGRVVVHGHEGGAGLAFLVALRHPDAIRAVAAVEPPMVPRPPDADPVHPLSVYLATAEKSPQAAVVRRGVKLLRDMKYPVTLVSLGQEPRYLSAEDLEQLVRWIDTLDRI